MKLARDQSKIEKEVYALECKSLDFFYGDNQALKNVSFSTKTNEITSFIGPSGCGKSTLLRCFNRMNDLIEGAKSDPRESFGSGIRYKSKGYRSDRFKKKSWHGLPTI